MKRRTIALTVALLLVLVLSFSIASCDKAKEIVDGITSLEAPTNIKYDVDAGQITWSSVPNAESYTIRINEGETYPVTKTSFPYQATADSFTVTITAKATLSSEEAVVTFSKLGTVESLSVDESGVVTWAAVDGANAYAIAIDGSVVGNAYEPLYRQMPVGSHSIKVKAIVEGNDAYYASWSSTKTMTILAQVDKDKIVYEDGYISWKAVTGASEYVVLVNGQAPADAIDGTRVPYDSDNRNFSVTVQAIGDHAISFDGKVSDQKDFVYLDTVTAVDVVDGILTWSAVNNADAYKIKLNGVVLTETFTECRYEGLVAEQNITFQVMPISNNSSYFANWSVVKNIQLLKKPVLQWNDSVELDGNALNSIYWDGISDASGYSVKVVDPTGKETVETFGESERSYANSYLLIGEYKVSMKANAPKTDSNVYDSVYSQSITVRRLAAPKQPEKDFVVSDPTALSEGFTLNFTKVAGATAYKLYKDDTAVTTSTVNQFKVGDLLLGGETDEQTYTYKVQSLGSISRANGVIVTLSSTTATSLPVNIKVLAVPSDLTISGKTLSYGAVAGNSGYMIAIGGDARHSGETTCDLSFLNAGAYKVSVCAKGNGGTTLASAYTEALNVERLAAPNDIRILTSDAAEGQLSYGEVEHAESYAAVFDNNDEQIPVNKNDNVKSRISTKGTTLYMISVADYYNMAGNVYYMTSRPSETKTFIKLATPTFGDPAFTNTQFTWNKPSNLNEKVYEPSYEVYEGIELQNGEINGTSMDISYLTAGTYTFKVKAIGNGTQYINSDESAPKTITKLATPTVTRAHDAQGYGVYEWAAVVDSTKYNVTIDGVNKGTFAHETDKTYQFKPDFSRIKTYVVSVVAIGDNGFNTINSDPWTIEQKVDQLAEPDFEIGYSADAFTDEGNIVVDITRESPYAVGYAYSVGGAEESRVGVGCTHYEKCPSSVGTYKVAVYALGGDYDEEGTFYIDSQRHGGNSSYQITLLAEPNADSIKISQDGKLSWATISGTSRYAISITVEGVEYLAKTTVSQPGYLIEDYVADVKGKNFAVTVQALGNGTTVISSKETTREFNA